MHFPDEGTDGRRAHAEEHPVDFVGQFPDHIGDQLQIAGMARAARPTDTWPLAAPPLRPQPLPPPHRQAVLDHPDIRVETGEGLCQGRRRHHEAVDVTQPATQRAQNVLRQVLAMGALEGHVGQIVVQLVDLEGPRERLHPPHGLETLLADLALQHQYVRVVALQIGHVHQADRQRAIDGCRLAQRAERLDHPVMAAAE